MTWVCELANFNWFIRNGKPNEYFVYYIGESLTTTPLSREFQKMAYLEAIKGNVYLVRKRKSTYEFNYLMIKASKPPIIKLVPFTDEQIRQYHNPKGPMRYVGKYSSELANNS